MAVKVKFDANGQCSWCRCMLFSTADQPILTDTYGRQYCRAVHETSHHIFLAGKALEAAGIGLDDEEESE